MLFKMCPVIEAGQCIVGAGVADLVLLALTLCNVNRHAQGFQRLIAGGIENTKGQVHPDYRPILFDETLVKVKGTSLSQAHPLCHLCRQLLVFRMGKRFPCISQQLLPLQPKQVQIALIDVADLPGDKVGKGHTDRRLFKNGL